jgi:hypothetical protein
METVGTEQWTHVTHLISDGSDNSRSGSKHIMCRKKNIPIVSLKWLAACVTSGKVQPPASFAIKRSTGTSATQAATQSMPEKVGPSQRIPAGTQGGFGMLGACFTFYFGISHFC